MMKTKINIEELYKKANFTPERFDKMRLEKLENMKTIQLERDTAHRKEKTRLTAKYGADHPRVKKMEAKLKFKEGFHKSLDMVIDNAAVEVPSFKENTWMVCGRVMDKNFKGIKGLTVSLYDKKGKWVEELGFSCTGERGFYSLVYDPGTCGIDISAQMELLLTVSDKQHNILHRQRRPLFVTIGKIDTRMIVTGDEEDICTPPEPGKESGTPQVKEEWKANGIIKDEKNKPLPGKKVKLVDEKGLCDKLVDSQETSGKGTFEFVVKGKQFRDLIEADGEIYLKVYNSRGRVEYTSPYAVKCRAGGEDSYDIQLPSKKKR